jgi:hypothetical protein
MSDWKIAGKFVKPKNMTLGSNKPWFVTKAAFHLLPLLIRTVMETSSHKHKGAVEEIDKVVLSSLKHKHNS